MIFHQADDCRSEMLVCKTSKRPCAPRRAAAGAACCLTRMWQLHVQEHTPGEPASAPRQRQCSRMRCRPGSACNPLATESAATCNRPATSGPPNIPEHGRTPPPHAIQAGAFRHLSRFFARGEAIGAIGSGSRHNGDCGRLQSMCNQDPRSIRAQTPAQAGAKAGLRERRGSNPHLTPRIEIRI